MSLTFVGIRSVTGLARVKVLDACYPSEGVFLRLPRVRKDEYRHSPTGVEWGYAGSGPAELARAVLLRVFGEDDARMRHPRCYQRFKRDVIEHLPRHPGIPGSRVCWTLQEREVRAWRDGISWDASERVEERRAGPT